MFDNIYAKGIIGAGILVAAITVFLVWPSSTAIETTEDTIEDVTATPNEKNKASTSLEVKNAENSNSDEITHNKDIMNQVNAAAKRAEDTEGADVDKIKLPADNN